MRIFPHFSVVGFCNTYIVGPQGKGDSVIIDPGHVDEELITLLVKHEYMVGAVLLTHSHSAHIEGLATLMKIYNPTVYAADPQAYPFPVTRVEDEKRFIAAGFHILPLLVPGHSLDSMVYVIDHAIFSGDTLESGRIATTNGYLEQELLLKGIQGKLMNLDENFLLFPGHGCISKLRIERMFNQDILKLSTIEKARSLWRDEE